MCDYCNIRETVLPVFDITSRGAGTWAYGEIMRTVDGDVLRVTLNGRIYDIAIANCPMCGRKFEPVRSSK